MSAANIDTDTLETAPRSAAASRQTSPVQDLGGLDDSVSDTEVNRDDEPIVINGDGTTVTPDALSTVDHNDDLDENESQEDGDLDADTGVSEDGDPICNHKKGKEDPHQEDLCEGCKKANGIQLCDLTHRCKHCLHLSPEDFQRVILNKRDLNAKKLDARRRRQQNQQQQASEQQRSSPRLRNLLGHVRQDIVMNPTGTTVVKLDAHSRARLEAKDHYRPAAVIKFDIENACFNELTDNSIDVHRYCDARRLHPFTQQYIARHPEFATCPLRHLSAYLDKQYPNPSSQQMPTIPASMMRVMAAADTGASTSTAAPQVDVAQATSDFLAYTDQMLRNPPRALAANDLNASDDSSTKAEDENLIRSIISYIAQHAPVDAVAPPSTAQAPTLRAGFQLRVEKPSKLCLTSSALLLDCLAVRDAEFHDAVVQHRARELGKLTPMKSLNVSTASLTPGDEMWPLRAPQMSPDFHHWLPAPNKNSSVVVTMNDLELLENTARALCRDGTVMDSAMTALATHFKRLANVPMFAELLDFIGMLLRDNVKLSVTMASSIMQLRRDYCLQHSVFDQQEKLELRASPLAACTNLFDDTLVRSTIERARIRNKDSRDAGLLKLAT